MDTRECTHHQGRLKSNHSSAPRLSLLDTNDTLSSYRIKGDLLLHLVSLVDDSKVVGQLPQPARDLSLDCFWKLESGFGRPPLGSAVYSKTLDTIHSTLWKTGSAIRKAWLRLGRLPSRAAVQNMGLGGDL
jgi:hypothetical protein